MKTIKNNIRFYLALAAILISFQACSKDGLNPSGTSKLTGQWAGLTGNKQVDEFAASGLFTAYSSGTAGAIKVDIDGDRKVDMSSFDGEYVMTYISLTMLLSNGNIVDVVFPRGLLDDLYNQPTRTFIISFRSEAAFGLVDGMEVHYKASLN